MIRTIQAEIKGTSALLMNRFPLVPAENATKLPPAEQAAATAYRDEKTGELYVPGQNLQRALVSAATFSKGKARASLQKVAAACLMITPEILTLGTKNFVVDSRAVVVPATGGRIVRHRARLNDWQLAFTLEFDDALLSEKEARKILDDCGIRVGIGDFRPERKGPFGRFMVTNWKVD